MNRAIRATAMACVLAWASTGWGISVFQGDDFQGGGLANWQTGADQTNVANGGPDGTGDRYMELSRSDFAFHIATNNQSQWTGDYLSAGVKNVRVDLNQTLDAGNDFQVRLLIIGPGGAFSTKDAVPVTQGSWGTVTFGLSADDLVEVFGSGNLLPEEVTHDLADTLEAVSVLNIRNDPGSTPTDVGNHPQHVLGELGIDNIRALPGIGDSNADGKVDGTDLAGWQQHYDPLGTGNGTFATGDWNGDGKVDGTDIALWQQNYDPLGTSGVDGASPVPEPATLLLMLGGATAGLLRRRRARS